MPAFTVYQQRTCTPNPADRGDFCANVAEVGQIEARNAAEAIRQAANWPCFRGARFLGRFPVVSEAQILRGRPECP